MIWHNIVLKMEQNATCLFKVRQFNSFEMMNHKTTLLFALFTFLTFQPLLLP